MDFVLGLYTGVFALVWWQTVLVIAIFTACVISLFDERTEVGTVFLIGVICVLLYFNIINIDGLSIISLLIYVFGYISIGCVWSLFKYKQEATTIAERNLKEYPSKTPEQTLYDINRSIENSKIAFWIIYFPISMIKFCLSDVVDYIISKLGVIHKSIAKAVVGTVYKDFKPEVKEKSNNKSYN